MLGSIHIPVIQGWLIDTSLRVILDISNTMAAFRAILTTLKTAVGCPEEVTVDKRCMGWSRAFSSTTEMAMGLITAGFLWCPQ